MKATDLMAGDWVFHVRNRIASGFEAGGPVRVLEIYEHGPQTTDGFVRNEDLEPIPITPEILEKNGFDGAYKKTYQIYESNGYDKLYISYWRGRLSIITSPDIRKKHSTNRIHIDCSYVHELQHCLALFGIEKEIEL
jgi:hypothetical protein